MELVIWYSKNGTVSLLEEQIIPGTYFGIELGLLRRFFFIYRFGNIKIVLNNYFIGNYYLQMLQNCVYVNLLEQQELCSGHTAFHLIVYNHLLISVRLHLIKFKRLVIKSGHNTACLISSNLLSKRFGLIRTLGKKELIKGYFQ